MTECVLKKILRHPIFGGAGERMIQVIIGERGIDLDSRWAVITDDGRLVTREKEDLHHVRVPCIANIRVTSGVAGVVATAPGMPALTIPYPARMRDEREALSVEWRGKGIEVSRECSVWASEYLSQEGRLDVYRLVELRHEEQLSFGGNEHLFVVAEEAFRNGNLPGKAAMVLGGVSTEEVMGMHLALIGGILFEGRESAGRGKCFSYRGSGIVREGAHVEVLQ